MQDWPMSADYPSLERAVEDLMIAFERQRDGSGVCVFGPGEVWLVLQALLVLLKKVEAAQKEEGPC